MVGFGYVLKLIVTKSSCFVNPARVNPSGTFLGFESYLEGPEPRRSEISKSQPASLRITSPGQGASSSFAPFSRLRASVFVETMPDRSAFVNRRR